MKNSVKMGDSEDFFVTWSIYDTIQYGQVESGIDPAMEGENISPILGGDLKVVKSVPYR